MNEMGFWIDQEEGQVSEIILKKVFTSGTKMLWIWMILWVLDSCADFKTDSRDA